MGKMWVLAILSSSRAWNHLAGLPKQLWKGREEIDLLKWSGWEPHKHIPMFSCLIRKQLGLPVLLPSMVHISIPPPPLFNIKKYRSNEVWPSSLCLSANGFLHSENQPWGFNQRAKYRCAYLTPSLPTVCPFKKTCNLPHSCTLTCSGRKYWVPQFFSHKEENLESRFEWKDSMGLEDRKKHSFLFVCS